MTADTDASDAVKHGLTPLFPKLWRYCLVLTGARERADELAQATCLRALEKADLFTLGTELDRWVFRIAQRLWLNDLRTQSVRHGEGLAPIEEIDFPEKQGDPESNFSARETLSAVMALPEAQRLTVLLVYAEGRSYREAAEILEIPIGAVMSRLAAARGKLADMINARSETK
ncbi:MAG: RNA polymerase sigma factor [Alphaproteobacteria bacterium]|nr:RNA polymerase sigma factor [Alphaproteobacteria bacterium]